MCVTINKTGDYATPAEITSFKLALLAELRRKALPASIVTNARGRILDAGWGVPTVSQIRRLQSR